jgi:hypothetical protein
MPPRRKATKSGSLAAEDSGIASSDKSQGKGAAGNEAATLGATAGRTRRQTTRTQSKTAKKSVSVDADLATATEKQVSQASSLDTVVIPWDRESRGDSTQGNGDKDVVRNSGSNVTGCSNQGLGRPGVSVGNRGGEAVPPSRLVASRPMHPASSPANADYPAQVDYSASLTSADRTASADYPASANYPATMTQTSMPHLPCTVVQHLPTSLPLGPRELSLPEVRELRVADQVKSRVEQSAIVGHGQSSGRHRRSLSANGYGAFSQPANQVLTRAHVDPPVKRVIDHSITLPVFDGYGDLNMFLQRFESIADYYGWPSAESLFRMKQRITGDAEYVLGDAIHMTSIQEFVNLLRARFGTEAHAERYRAELARLRRGTMTLEQLHLRVYSLVSRAMPGHWSKSTDIYARDAFLTALDDDELRRRIMMACPPPETLSAVFDLAVRASAIDETFRQTAGRGDSWEERQPGRRQRFTRVLTNETDCDYGHSSEAVGRMEFQKMKDDQQKLMSELTAYRERLAKAESMLAARPSEPETTSNPSSASSRRPVEQREKKSTRSIGFDVCRRCGMKGHWARECPLTVTASGQASGTASESTVRARANALTSLNRPRVRVYVQIVYQGQFYRALLDTGCDVSVIGARMLPGLAYQECREQPQIHHLYRLLEARSCRTVLESSI